jgi:hypothetical protein
MRATACLVFLAVVLSAPPVRGIGARPPDVPSQVFEGAATPAVPRAFGKLRFGMTEAQARKAAPALVMPAGATAPAQVEIPGLLGATMRQVVFEPGRPLSLMAIRFDSPATKDALARLWGAPIEDGKAVLWFDGKQRIRARLENGELELTRYLPTAELLARKSPLVRKRLAALVKPFGKARPNDSDGTDMPAATHLLTVPALEWEPYETSTVGLKVVKGQVVAMTFNARTPDFQWHTRVRAQLVATYGEPVSAGKKEGRPGTLRGQVEDEAVFEDKTTRVTMWTITDGKTVSRMEVLVERK